MDLHDELVHGSIMATVASPRRRRPWRGYRNRTMHFLHMSPFARSFTFLKARN
jgi:hypothetical protein